MADEEDRDDSAASEGDEDDEDDDDLEVGVLGEQSLQSAQACLLQRNYRRAFAHYLLVLRIQPERRAEIKDNFVLALREWAEQLEQAGRLQDMFTCYQQACELFPDCETMLNNMGAHLFRLGFIDEAASYFWKALKIDPDFLGARQNLENVCSHLVERWHFRMLNDRRRNLAYQEAIHRAIENGCDSMLDIGSGTGLLSMFAAQTGAEVYACEMSKTMYEMSCDIVGANQLTDDVMLLHKRSNDLVINQDLPKRVSLIVTETFDSGLLGEHVLSSLKHAWDHLLASDNERKSHVIPEAATVYIAVIESAAIRKQSRFLYPGIRHLDLSEVSLKSKVTTTSSGSNLSSINYQDINEGEDDTEPYTSERLTALHGGYKLLTKPYALSRVNFNDPEDIDRCLKGWKEKTNLLVCKPGKVDALTLWFDLHLDCETTLVCGPETESCWEQAVYPVHTDHLSEMTQTGKEDNLYVRAGDKLDITCDCRNNAFYLQCTHIYRQKYKCQPPYGAGSQAYLSNSHPTIDIGLYGFNADSANVVALNNNSLFDCTGLSNTWSLQDSPPLLRADAANGNVTTTSTSCRNQQHLPNTPCSCAVSLSFGTVMERGQLLSPQPALSSPIIFPSLVDVHHPTMTSNGTSSERRPAQATSGHLYSSWNTYHLQKQPNNQSPPSQAGISVNLNYVHSIPAGSQTTGTLAKSLLFTSSVDRDGIWSHSPLISNGGVADSANNKPDTSPMWTIPSSQYASAFTPVTSAVIDNVCSPSLSENTQVVGRLVDVCDTSSLQSLPEKMSHDDSSEKTGGISKKQEDILKACFLLEGAELERLNDLDLNLSYCNVLEHLIQQQAGVLKSVRVLDITQGASLLPLQALKMGANEVGVVTRERANQQLLLHLASINHLQPGHIHFERGGFEEMEPGWSVLITELVEPCGCLRQQVLEDIALARVTCLTPDATVVPCSARVCGMLIDSPSLHKDSAVVSDENTLGFLVSAFMNDFQMTTHVDIELSTLEYTKLSDPFEMFTFDFTEQPSGTVPAYLNQSTSLQITATDIGQVTAVLYWFELQLGNGLRVCTLDQNLHWRQAAVMQRGSLSVSTGTPLILRALCQNSCISAMVNMPPSI